METRNAVRCITATLALLALANGGAVAGEPEVWTGLDFQFVRGDGVDGTAPENQDRITENVWIARGNFQGIYNAAQEGGYTINVSPVDTEWATGSAADWESLTFQPWQAWTGGAPDGPPNSVGVEAVVHLITDDIYIDIRFDSWTASGGGGFAYMRATGQTPVAAASWSAIKGRFSERD